jgi:hypothetical protein
MTNSYSSKTKLMSAVDNGGRDPFPEFEVYKFKKKTF